MQWLSELPDIMKQTDEDWNEWEGEDEGAVDGV
jgi:hypothetical protein